MSISISSIIDEIENRINDTFKAPQDESPKRRRSSKYKVKKNNWQRNKNRCNRENGKSYTGKKKNNGKWQYNLVKEPRTIKQACFCILSGKERSALKCRDITEDERQTIFKSFWQITWPEKKMFVKIMFWYIPPRGKEEIMMYQGETFLTSFIWVEQGKEYVKPCFLIPLV